MSVFKAERNLKRHSKKAIFCAILLSLSTHCALSFWSQGSLSSKPLGSSSLNVSLRQAVEQGDSQEALEKNSISPALPAIAKEVPQTNDLSVPEAFDNSLDNEPDSAQSEDNPGQQLKTSSQASSEAQQIEQAPVSIVATKDQLTRETVSNEASVNGNAVSNFVKSTAEALETVPAPSDSDVSAMSSDLAADSSSDTAKPSKSTDTHDGTLNSVSQAPAPRPAYTLGSATNPEPKYPTIASRRGWQGTVVIGVNVNTHGGVESLLIIQSSHFGVLDHAAWETIKDSWSFEPAKLNGKNVASYIEIPITFQIN